ncbi:undecaprenyldiphospho-muramoylpentapeptide beta-N-acetylglucosaminyltransferase [Desulfovibrio sp. OttesenSCG-928-M14]|nr:undecaprenyldiphospho-muramoylpentapeptide beta-N-acetylglucosaminyltransferase [Desulfovibrio sp. OttesenSCG-928-M14]
MFERIIVTTGGTGGHIFPAIAVAEEIRRKNPSAMILFMGGRYGQEADLAVNAGLDFVGLPVRGVMGRGVKGLFAAFGMSRGLAKAAYVIKKTRPQAVIGFGGYAAFAGVMAAALAGVPTALHEQNAFPGMSNRLLGRMVKRIFLSMPDTAGVFDAEKCILTGNPVRSGIQQLYEQRLEDAKPSDGTRSYYGGVDAPSPFASPGAKPLPISKDESGPDAGQTTRRAPRLLVTGGSQGARAMNDAMLAVAGSLLEVGVQIRHQTGQADYERVRAAYRETRADTVRVEPFIMDMPKAYAWADLVFCRAGASTLAEITAAGLPALLTPFPRAAQDHQRHNARFMAGQGAARMLEQNDFQHEPAILSAALLELLRDAKGLEAMAASSLALARPYAARDLVLGLEALVFGPGRKPEQREADNA